MKTPDYSLYDIGSNVELECHAEKVTNQYRFEWSKVGSERILARGRILSLKSLSESESGTYKCKISRFAVRYSSYKLINITVKGNYISIPICTHISHVHFVSETDN